MLTYFAKLLRDHRNHESETRRIARRPDRLVLTETLLPAFSGFRSILWIGCRVYTQAYYATLEQQGAECWTIDIDPDAAQWGHPERHVVGDITVVDSLFEPGRFDAILCNGIFGWGVDTLEAQGQALATMSVLLRPEGILLLGWNDHRVTDPVSTAAHLFERHSIATVPSHIAIRNSTHRYDLLKKKEV